MEFQYTLDPNAEVPIMLIDKHIGNDPEEGNGVMANQFCKELMFLDNLGKKSIDIWINSPGGDCSEGEQIYGTILKTKTPVDTHNIGMAASIAGPIALAGRKRYMMDYAKFMMHPVAGGDEKSRKAFENSVVSMLSGRSDMNETQVQALMSQTTWLNINECETLGICTHRDVSTEYNKPRKLSNTSDAKALWKEYSHLVNNAVQQQTTKTNTMIKVTNKLQLNTSANEDAICDAIDAIMNSAKLNKKEMEDKLNKLNMEKEEADDRYNKMKNDYDKMVTDSAAVAATNKLAKEEADKKAADAVVDEAVKAGKISNVAEVITAYKEMAHTNLDNTKKVIEALPVNKTGPKVITSPVNSAIDKDDKRPSINIENPNAFVQYMNAKNYNKAKARIQ